MNDRATLWIKTILHEASRLDDHRGIALLHACGGACAGTSALLEGAAGIRAECPPDADDDTLFAAFKTRHAPAADLTKTGNEITLIFEACTCPLVKEGVTDPFLCHCTAGYSQKLFTTLFGRPVRVELRRSILNGDPVCEQKILLKE